MRQLDLFGARRVPSWSRCAIRIFASFQGRDINRQEWIDQFCEAWREHDAGRPRAAAELGEALVEVLEAAIAAHS